MPRGNRCTVSLEEDLARVEACIKVLKNRAKLIVDVNKVILFSYLELSHKKIFLITMILFL